MVGPVQLRTQKSLLTRYSNTLNQTIAKFSEITCETSLKVLSEAAYELTATSRILEEALNSYIKTVDDLGETITEEQETQIQGYIDKAQVTLETAQSLIIQIDTKKVGLQQPTWQEPLPTEVIGAKTELPPIPIPTFNGNISEFENFWTLFSANVHNQKLSNLQKFNYLLQTLRGEAREVIRRYPVTEENYELAIEVLQTKFGDKSKIIYDLQMRLDKANARSPLIPDQRKLLEYLFAITTQLEKKGVSLDGSFIVQKVLSKFSQGLQRKVLKVQIEAHHDEWKLIQLLSDLDKIISSEEKVAEMLKNNEPLQRQSKPQFQRRVENAQTQAQCIYCGAVNHNSLHCTKFDSIQKRTDFLMKNKKCLNCTRANHFLKECNNRGCSMCAGKKHHFSLCPKRMYRQTDDLVQRRNNPTASNQHHPKINRTDLTERSNQSCAISTNPEGNNTVTQTSSLHTTIKSQHNGQDNVFLLTGVAKVRTKSGEMKAIDILLDTGADKSFIKRKLADDLQLPTTGSVELSVFTFGSDIPKKQRYEISPLQIWDEKGNVHDLVLCKTETITEKIKSARLTKPDTEFLRKHNIALCKTEKTEINPDVLLGCDQLWPLLNTSCRQQILPSGLIAIPSKLGYLLTGRQQCGGIMRNMDEAPCRAITTTLSTSEMNELDLWDRYWSLDSAGVEEYTGSKYSEKAKVNEKVLQYFHDTIEKRNDGYYVRLPFKETCDQLPTNKAIAYRRLASVLKMLHTNSELLQQYHGVFQEQLKTGILEEVVDTASEVSEKKLVHYLPHQPVVTPHKHTTKLRIVFDASSHFKGCPSLNDALYQGPLILPELYGILLRFRMKANVAIADVEKAFLQIRLNEKDRDVTRCLWVKNPQLQLDNDNIAVYRFTRVTFGLNVSPFLLAATIQHHINYEMKDKKLANEISDNLYVDNLIIMGDTPDEVVNKAIASRELFQQMNMNLREFLANDSRIQDKLPIEAKTTETTQKVLGISWNSTKDQLTIDCEFPAIPKITKRNIAKQIASIYDPLGWLIPLLVPHKKFQQKVWVEGYSWDQELSKSLQEEWNEIKDDAQSFHKTFNRHLPVKNCENLAVFADASEQAMAACAYVFHENKSELLMGKSKLPSIKSKTTIPKLEMNALTMATRLAHSICEVLRSACNGITNVFLFSDSQIVLSWTRNFPKKDDAGVFVHNRLKEMRKIVEELSRKGTSVHFGYVATTFNPADAGTRGLSKEQLKTHEWWTGPEFLRLPQATWNKQTFQWLKSDENATSEEGQALVGLTMARPEENQKFLLSRYSSLRKAQRIVAWILRFLRRLLANMPQATTSRIRKSVPELGEMTSSTNLTALEMRQARIILIKEHQSLMLNPEYIKTMEKTLKLFKDRAGVWRARGRLGFSAMSDDAKFPIFVAPKSTLALRIISEAHGEYHRGIAHTICTVRREFWIPKLRQQVRSFISGCVRCKRFNGLPYKYPEMSDLPSRRVQQTRPFEHIGIDFFDLPQVMDNHETIKTYGCIFTCTATRLIHLETLKSMSAEAFLNALRRFFARRGVPKSITSDNAPTFQLTAEIMKDANHQNLLEDFAINREIEWRTITPYAPWQGGFYERLIKSVKEALYKSLGRAKISYDSLVTVVTEIEATLNSRPLTYQETDCDYYSTVRPIDFIQSRLELTFPTEKVKRNTDDPDYHSSAELAALETRNQVIESLQTSMNFTCKFWKVWREQYLTSLREQHRTRMSGQRGSSLNPKEGAIVLLMDPIMPRNDWRMAKITKVNASSDGAVRELELITSTKRTIKRPVNLVVPLEIQDEETAPPQDTENNTNQNHYNLRPRKNISYRENLIKTTNVWPASFCSATKSSAVMMLMILAVLWSPTTCKPVSETIRMECQKNGVAVKNADTTQEFEICAEGECKLYKKPSPYELVRFSPELTLHEHNVLLKWHHNTTLQSMEMKCQGLDFCENIQCNLCTAVILNPECWPIGSLVGATLILYIIVALIYILLYVPITVGKPIRLILHGIFIFIVYFFRIIRRCLRNTVRLPTNDRRLRRIAAAIAIVTISNQVLPTFSCQDVNVFSIKTNTCTSKPEGEICEVKLANVLKINNYRQEACLRIYAKNALLFHLKIRWKGLFLHCDHQVITYTRDVEIHTLDSKRCPHMGSCSGQKCASVNSSDLLPELEKANRYPGRTGCLESCGGIGCDCFYPSSGCLFYRVYAKPTGKNVFELSKCARWKEEVKLEITVEDLKDSSVYVIPVSPNVPTTIQNFTITLTSLALPPLPILNKKFLSDGDQIAIFQENDELSLYCKTLEDAQNLKCDLRDKCDCGAAENKVRCECKSPSLASYFGDLTRKLPLNTQNALFYQGKQTQVIARIRDTASSEFIIEFRGIVNKTIQEIQSDTCTIENAILSGCYRCEKGAEATIVCKSTRRTLAEVRCEQETMTIPCSPKGENATLRLLRNTAHMENESRLRRELRKLKSALPPLPSPAKLYDDIIEASTMVMITIEIFDQLKEDSSFFHVSNAPYGELERDTQLFELRTDNCKLRLEFLRQRLRLLFSTVPVLIATKAMNENAWKARMERPQHFISRDGRRKPLLTDANQLEIIINDQIRCMDEFFTTIEQTRAACLTQERMERDTMDVRMYNAMQSIQQTMVEIKEGIAKQTPTIKNCAAWTQTTPVERQKMCKAVQTSQHLAPQARTTPTEAPPPPTVPQMPPMPPQPMMFPSFPYFQPPFPFPIPPTVPPTVPPATPPTTSQGRPQDRPSGSSTSGQNSRRSTERAALEITALEEKLHRIQRRMRELEKRRTCKPREYEGGVSREGELTMKCVFCAAIGEHYSDSCPRMKTGAERRGFLRRHRRCSNCLELHCQGGFQCIKYRIPCFHCKLRGHHSAVCDLPEETLKIETEKSQCEASEAEILSRLETLRHLQQ
ncbi:unnamed protein product [Cylicostephanus goldi]|uniref:Integrase catalytic domain-containing protein n=1 Tax=Cylicostephanus goldi TaxID=71465 RepID=A0A3P6R5Q4_CYLGO|nr:unnamed protein product [Cylicostephanus goldi]